MILDVCNISLELLEDWQVLILRQPQLMRIYHSKCKFSKHFEKYWNVNTNLYISSYFRQNICIRQEAGYCCIQYNKCSDPNSFAIDNTGPYIIKTWKTTIEILFICYYSKQYNDTINHVLLMYGYQLEMECLWQIRIVQAIFWRSTVSWVHVMLQIMYWTKDYVVNILEHQIYKPGMQILFVVCMTKLITIYKHTFLIL